MNKPNAGRASVPANFLWILFGRIGSDAALFVFYVMLTRVFGQVGIGQYAFAMSLTAIVAYLADFGLHRYSARSWADEKVSFKQLAGRVLALRITLLPVAFATLVLATNAVPMSRQEAFVVGIVGIHNLLFTFANGWMVAFVAHQQARLASLLDACAKIATLLVGAALILSGADLVLVLVAMPLSTLCLMLVAIVATCRQFGVPEIRAGFRNLASTAKAAFPGFLSVFGRQIAVRSDIVLLGLLLGTTASGTYSVGQRVVWILMAIPALAAVALLPEASRLFRSDEKKLDSLYARSLDVAILISFPIGVGLFLVSEELIFAIFGTGFSDAVVVLKVLSLFIVLSCIRNVMSVFMTACEQELDRARIEWGCASVGIALQIILIEGYGIVGAAIATAVMEGLTVFVVGKAVTVTVRDGEVRHRFKMALIGCAAFSGAWVLFDHPAILLFVPLSIAIYFIVLFLSSSIRRNEFAYLSDYVFRRIRFSSRMS